MTTTPKKKILILKACDDMLQEELDNIKAVAKMLGLDTASETVTADKDLDSCFNAQREYDYVYLCAHASVDGFGSADVSGPGFSWRDLASALCRGRCLKPGAILLLAACRGGTWKIASELFEICEEIEYVCGPRWEAFSTDLATSFHVFLYNMEWRREQPSTAAARASAATGFDVFCHDRIEARERMVRENVYGMLEGVLQAHLQDEDGDEPDDAVVEAEESTNPEERS